MCIGWKMQLRHTVANCDLDAWIEQKPLVITSYDHSMHLAALQLH